MKFIFKTDGFDLEYTNKALIEIAKKNKFEHEEVCDMLQHAVAHTWAKLQETQKCEVFEIDADENESEMTKYVCRWYLYYFDNELIPVEEITDFKLTKTRIDIFLKANYKPNEEEK